MSLRSVNSDQLLQIARRGVSGGTEAINAMICIADVAQEVRHSACCLEALKSLLEKQCGLAGMNLAGTHDAPRKAHEVAAYIDSLLEELHEAKLKGRL